jgi:hypothetical protein
LSKVYEQIDKTDKSIYKEIDNGECTSLKQNCEDGVENKSKKTKEKKADEIVPGLDERGLGILQRLIEVGGVEEKDMPYILGVSEEHSIASWENLSPKVRYLFDKAREQVLNKVENSILRLALGGWLRTIKVNPDGKIYETRKEVFPDLRAIEKILGVFRPEVWARIKDFGGEDSFKTPQRLSNEETDRIKILAGKFFEALKEGQQTRVLV